LGLSEKDKQVERDSKTRLKLTPPPPASTSDSSEELKPRRRAHSETTLGLPPPSASSSGVYEIGGGRGGAADEDSALRRTRPGWIAVALQGGAPKVDDKLNLVPGQEIPGTRYRIERWLGDGGMGVVYEAQHLDLERRVALKILRAEATRTPQAIQMFRDEARTASRIGSEYITEIFDFGELADGRLLFAMELLKGCSLNDELRTGPIDGSRAIGILRQVCKGLAAAHGAGIIHRDVKPENIFLLRRTGRHDAVKLLDFGVSTMADAGVEADSGVAGTAYYIAPELVAGMPYDTRVDMYALGCTAYEMLTGRPPFEAKPLEQLLLSHVEEEAELPSKVNKNVDIPKALERVVMKCLAKNPQDRYADMADLEAALCEAQIEAQLNTTWDDLPLPEVDPERKDRLLRRMPDPAAMISKQRWFWPLIAAVAVVVALGLGYLAMKRNEPTVAELDRVDELTWQARDAAASAYYVYPPTGQPDARTAYAVVRELEALGFSNARERAEQLRTEFGDALTKIGDRYWEQEDGKPFALDYYVQALVFDPDHATAATRARTTPGQLLALQDKAEERSFTEDELIAAEPLAALAEEDPEARAEKLAALDDAGHQRSATVEQKLEGLSGKKRRRKTRRKEVADAVDTAEAEGAAGQAEASGDAGSEDGAAAGGAPQKKFDPHQAEALAAEGWSSLKSGNGGKAEGSFQKALAAYPRNAAALSGLAKIYFDKAKYSRAANYAKKAVRAAPGNADYRIQAGDAYYKLYRYEDALKHYQKAEALGHGGAAKRVKKTQAKVDG
jgi:tetratricopeptide (TPR) repeat protein